MKLRACSIVILFFFLFLPSNVFASSYVLPYPSAMPGNKLYSVNKVIELVGKYWYFGDFGKIAYDQKYSDKYLVEAKTLFEYQQYLLAVSALKKSDSYYEQMLLSLTKAEKNNKNIRDKRISAKEMKLKHIETIKGIKESVPESFIWQPEREGATALFLRDLLNQSISIRRDSL